MTPHQIIQILESAAEADGRSPSTWAREASGSGDQYTRLIDGCDITTRRAARIVQWLSDHWPPPAVWPPDIPRPPPAPDSPAAPAADPPPAETDLGTALARIDELREERTDAMRPADGGRTDWGRVESLGAEILRLGSRLGPDGEIASAALLARALGVSREEVYGVTTYYRDGGRGERGYPRGDRQKQILGALVAAGDERFASRWRTAA